MATSFSRLPPLPALRDFIHLYKLRAKKVLSQNYLMDMNLTKKIVRSAGVQSGDWVCEVGPGPGGITRAILDADCERVDVVEIDKRMIPPLQHLAETSSDRMHIHQGDVLKTDIGEIWHRARFNRSTNWHEDPPPMHIIGNLPFNIATPLIIRYLKDMSYRRGPWQFGRVPLTLTFQAEVARRLCGPIDSDSRSRISIMAQYVAEPKLVFTIAGSCFVPPPKVDVGVVKFIPRTSPFIDVAFEVVEKVVRHVFHYRQKHVIKGLKTLYPEDMAHDLSHELLSEARIDPTTTSIRIGIDQFGDLARGYERQCRRIPGLFLYDYTKKRIKLSDLVDKEGSLPPVYSFKGSIPSEGVRLDDFEDYVR